MNFVEIVPKQKHQKSFDEFINSLNFDNSFSEKGVIAKRDKNSVGSIRLEFNIADKNYLLADITDQLKYWILVDLKLYEEQKFFSKTYYGIWISFIENSETKPKKFIHCMLPEIQDSYQSIRLILNILVKKYFNYKLPLTKKNVNEILDLTGLKLC